MTASEPATARVTIVNFSIFTLFSAPIGDGNTYLAAGRNDGFSSEIFSQNDPKLKPLFESTRRRALAKIYTARSRSEGTGSRYGSSSATTTGARLRGHFGRAEPGGMRELRPCPRVDPSLRLGFVAGLERGMDLGTSSADGSFCLAPEALACRQFKMGRKIVWDHAAQPSHSPPGQQSQSRAIEVGPVPCQCDLAATDDQPGEGKE